MGNFSSTESNNSTFPSPEEVENMIEEKKNDDLEMCLRRIKHSAHNGKSESGCRVEFEDTLKTLEQLGYTVTDLVKEERKRREEHELSKNGDGIPFCSAPPRRDFRNTDVSWEEKKSEGIFNGYQFTASRARTIQCAVLFDNQFKECKERLENGKLDCPIEKKLGERGYDDLASKLEEAGYANVELSEDGKYVTFTV